jgi:hypothetical protein
MDELDSTNGESRIIKALAPQQRSYALFHSPVVLFDYMVERAARPRTEFCWQGSLFLEFAHCPMRGRIPVESDLLRYPALLDRPL